MSVRKKFKHLEIPIQLIKSATNNFDESHLIGRGGFGDVYKGELLQLEGHTMAALKRLEIARGQGEPEFWKEVMTLSLYKHENIVSLLGFCDEKGEKILVYKYASKGSLDSHLKSKNLTWVRRLKICIGAARGLAYLHNPILNKQRVLHRDIKCSNIILDDDWNAIIADFGLSIRVPIKQEYSFMVSDACGTAGYCDPLYAETGFLTKESDVYSFGVVLFEVLCGRLCIDNKDEHQRLTELIQNFGNNIEEVIYDGIKDEINPSALQEFTTIAYQCLRREREERPLMEDVVLKLESALKYQLEPIEIQPEDIISATNNFAEGNYIGQRGFGKVYKGKLVLWKGPTMVSLQRLGSVFAQARYLEQLEEIMMLSGYRHENIISLLGFCDENGDKILVQEYASKGSLDLHLGSNHLTWVQRLKICIGVTRGLAYLHNPGWTQQRLIHRNMSSSNILLDENWNAKIVDFGLSKFVQSMVMHTFIFTRPIGNLGYCDPMYMETGLVTKESDVYSLGVILFEVLCGRLCSDNHTHNSLIRLVRKCYRHNKINEIIFGDMKDEIHPGSLEAFTTIAYQCISLEYEQRPLTKEIVTALETALEYQVQSPCSKSSNVSPPLHWEKTRATVGSLWAVSDKQGEQSRAPQIDMTELESLFCEPSSEKLKPEDINLVNRDLASNCQFMIRNINIPRPDIINVILALDSSAVAVDQADDLIKLCPTKEEMEMLMSYTGDMEKLGQREQFVLECAKIPRIKSKLRAFAFTITFNSQVNYLTDSLNKIKDATKEIRESTKLVKIMQIILMMGNKLNTGTVGGSAGGFRLDSLEKLGTTYATDKDITLLHFLCKVVAEQTPELLDFDKDLIHLKAAYMHKTRIRNVRQLKYAIVGGFEEVQQEFHVSANDGFVSAQFRKGLKFFLHSAGAKLQRLTSLFDEVDQYADSLAVYFAEDPSRCPWEQVISSLVRFIGKFKKAHMENKRWADTEKKKLEENV
ncbi:uncharacterized protein LOC111897526 isoform X1 [Lactuca sativa]|uniref:uncharacterized protein LOC111897526 isoform X1 n=1 Tax=Lactuca sativa TaxID=4236 RepID=UPI000CAC1D8D|nr:uncharacterized protein LOC111897526 isoform X1 [Lactuca sativa]